MMTLRTYTNLVFTNKGHLFLFPVSQARKQRSSIVSRGAGAATIPKATSYRNFFKINIFYNIIYNSQQWIVVG